MTGYFKGQYIKRHSRFLSWKYSRKYKKAFKIGKIMRSAQAKIDTVRDGEWVELTAREMKAMEKH